MGNLFQDLRYGARMLLKSPGFTLTAVLTLALGIGANTAIFSVINGTLLKPLPYPEPEQIVRLFEKVDRETMASDRVDVAPATFLDWQEQSRSFSDMAFYASTGLPLADGGDAERIEGALASVELFSVLGVKPLLGRTFTAEDERSGNRYLAVLSFDLWQRRFGGAADIVGRTIQLDGYSFSVVGVMPPGFHFPQRADLWELYRLNDNQRLMREAHFLKAVARLKPDVTVAQAQSEMSVIAGRLAKQYPQTNRNWGVNVMPLLQEEVDRSEPALLILLVAVGLVLLIACANVASLMLARAATRQTEFGIRLALGAGRPRIIRQLLTESLLLSGMGGVAGMLAGFWVLEGLLALAPDNLPRLNEVRLDSRVFGFTVLVTLATGILFGLAPAWQSARQDVRGVLKGEAGRVSSSRRSLFSMLVTAEMALTLMLLIGAGLLVSNFLRLQRVEPGIDVERLLTVKFEPPSARYNSSGWRTERLNFWNRLSARVAALPGVEAVGAIDRLPFSGTARAWRFRRDGEEANVATGPMALFQVVTTDYFRTVGIELRRGRVFTTADHDGTPPVAVINETMARRFWPEADAIGRRIVIRNETFAREIIGVVTDVRHFGLDREVEPEMYVPFDQLVVDVMPMVVRVKGDPAQIIGAVREQAKAVDTAVAVAELRPMRDLLSDSLAQRRFTMIVMGVFALTALSLAAIGIYGVISYSVAQRTREIGIRMALGAQKSDLLKLVIRQGLAVVPIGMAIGLAASLALTRLMSSLLLGVSVADLKILIAMPLLLAAAALLACYIPARRAAKVDPVIALRSE